jgi:hypothetical protein
MKRIDIVIANTLEKLQDINPELYGEWYSKLYVPYGDTKNWNMDTLNKLQSLIAEK